MLPYIVQVVIELTPSARPASQLALDNIQPHTHHNSLLPNIANKLSLSHRIAFGGCEDIILFYFVSFFDLMLLF